MTAYSAGNDLLAARRRILVVDDDENTRNAIVEALSLKDIQVEAAESGEAALSLLAAKQFDLALLDLRMPGMSGMEVLKQVGRSYPDVPVILVTAYGTVQTAVEAIKAGATDVIEKPLDPGAIRSAVFDVLDRAGNERAVERSFSEHLRLAKENLLNRRLGPAVEHARRALALQPSEPAPFNILGVVMQLKMEVAEAQKYFRSAVALDEGYAPAMKNLENLSGFPKDLSHFELDE